MMFGQWQQWPQGQQDFVSSNQQQAGMGYGQMNFGFAGGYGGWNTSAAMPQWDASQVWAQQPQHHYNFPIQQTGSAPPPLEGDKNTNNELAPTSAEEVERMNSLRSQAQQWTVQNQMWQQPPVWQQWPMPEPSWFAHQPPVWQPQPQQPQPQQAENVAKRQESPCVVEPQVPPPDLKQSLPKQKEEPAARKQEVESRVFVAPREDLRHQIEERRHPCSNRLEPFMPEEPWGGQQSFRESQSGGRGWGGHHRRDRGRFGPRPPQDDRRSRFDAFDRGDGGILPEADQIRQRSKQEEAKSEESDVKQQQDEFELQFEAWEKQFLSWKEQNENHPDRDAFSKYEEQYFNVRQQLLRRREQMRRFTGGSGAPQKEKEEQTATLGKDAQPSKDLKTLTQTMDPQSQSKEQSPQRPVAHTQEMGPQRQQAPNQMISPTQRPKASYQEIGPQRQQAPNQGIDSQRPQAPNQGISSQRPQAPNQGIGAQRPQAPSQGIGSQRPQAPNQGIGSQRLQAPNQGIGSQRLQAPNQGIGSQRLQAPNQAIGLQRPQALNQGIPLQRLQAPNQGIPLQRPQAPNQGLSPQRQQAPNQAIGWQRQQAPNQAIGSQRPQAPNQEMSPQRQQAPNQAIGWQRQQAPNQAIGSQRPQVPNQGMGPQRPQAPNQGMGPQRPQAPNQDLGPQTFEQPIESIGPQGQKAPIREMRQPSSNRGQRSNRGGMGPQKFQPPNRGHRHQASNRGSFTHRQQAPVQGTAAFQEEEMHSQEGDVGSMSKEEKDMILKTASDLKEIRKQQDCLKFISEMDQWPEPHQEVPEVRPTQAARGRGARGRGQPNNRVQQPPVENRWEEGDQERSDQSPFVRGGYWNRRFDAPQVQDDYFRFGSGRHSYEMDPLWEFEAKRRCLDSDDLPFVMKTIDYGHRPAQDPEFDPFGQDARVESFDYGHGRDVHPVEAPLEVIDYGHGQGDDGRDRHWGEKRDYEETPRFAPSWDKKKGFQDDSLNDKKIESTIGETVAIRDLLHPPGRLKRPKYFCIVLRGLPGSGKSYVAKLIKDKECENGGSAPRMLCLDDYFMVETEKTVKDPETGKRVKTKEFVYDYEAEMEEAYRRSLFKSFKKTVDDKFFPFIVLDAVNARVQHFQEFWSYAKQKGFQVYVAAMECSDPVICQKRNTHRRSPEDIRNVLGTWEETPRHMNKVDVRSLLQDDAIAEVEMLDALEQDNQQMQAGDEEDEELPEHVPSKWEVLEATEEKLARLDGLRAGKRKHSTFEDYLQLPDDYDQRRSQPGKKRVRWADLEERKNQDRLRAIGFVVGQTDWSKITDPSHADRALIRTKYI